MIVVDTNVLVSLLLPGQLHAAALRLAERESDWTAPLLVRSELRNVLATFLRRKKLDFHQALGAMERAECILSGRLHEMPSLDVLALADQSECTAYDCEFVVLAQKLRVMLVTEDQRLQECFPKVAVPLAHSHLL